MVAREEEREEDDRQRYGDSAQLAPTALALAKEERQGAQNAEYPDRRQRKDAPGADRRMERVPRDRRLALVNAGPVRPVGQARVFRLARSAGRIVDVIIPVVGIERQLRLFPFVGFRRRLLRKGHMVALMRVRGRKGLMRNKVGRKERAGDD